MLNFFGDLLTYSLIAPLVLRLTLSFYLLYLAVKALKSWHVLNNRGKGLSIIEAFVGAAIFVGLFTQLASILAIILLWVRCAAAKKSGTPSWSENAVYTILSIIAFSLLFTGAGFWAFDLPL